MAFQVSVVLWHQNSFNNSNSAGQHVERLWTVLFKKIKIKIINAFSCLMLSKTINTTEEADTTKRIVSEQFHGIRAVSTTRIAQDNTLKCSGTVLF